MITPIDRFRCAGHAARAAVVALLLAPSLASAQAVAPGEAVQPAGALAPATAVVGSGVPAPGKKAPKLAIAKVVGTLTDAATGEPLVGGQIGVQGLPLGNVSDDTGAYYINNVPAGKQTFTVEYLGYQPAAREVVIEPGAPVTLDFALDPEPIEGDEVVVEENSLMDLSDYVNRTAAPVLKPSPLKQMELERSDTTLMEDWHKSWKDFNALYSIEYPMMGERVYFRRPADLPSPPAIEAPSPDELGPEADASAADSGTPAPKAAPTGKPTSGKGSRQSGASAATPAKAKPGTAAQPAKGKPGMAVTPAKGKPGTAAQPAATSRPGTPKPTSPAPKPRTAQPAGSRGPSQLAEQPPSPAPAPKAASPGRGTR
jgi:hypothetical protein